MLQYLIEEYLPGYKLPKRRVATSRFRLEVMTSTVMMTCISGPFRDIELEASTKESIVAIRMNGGSLYVLCDNLRECPFFYLRGDPGVYLTDVHQYVM